MSAGLRAARAFAVWLLLIVAARNADAGAWLMPPGEGQIIAGTAFSGSSRAFDAHGNLIPVPSYDKFELGAYIEYGLTDWLTLVAAPAYDVIRQPTPAPSYTGPGESGIGGRFKLYQSDAFVASLQTTLLTPGASFNGAEPHRAGAIDLRAMAGASFAIGAWPAFADAAAGYRFYAQAQPGEWKLDLTLGCGLRHSFSSCCRALARCRRPTAPIFQDRPGRSCKGASSMILTRPGRRSSALS